MDQGIPGLQILGSWESAWEQKQSRVTCPVPTLTPGHLLLVIAWKAHQARKTCGVDQYGPSCSACSRHVPPRPKRLQTHSPDTQPADHQEQCPSCEIQPVQPRGTSSRLPKPVTAQLSVVHLHNTLHKRGLWSTANVKHTVVIKIT